VNRYTALSRATPLLLVLLLLAQAGGLWAGVTGKVAGVVVNASTGEPIVNANVVLAGTDFGAATSLDGDYFIINVPPGVYTVTASYIGYISLTQEEVMVFADLTATLDFKLESTVLEGQEVVVKAARRVLRHDMTASTRLATGDEIYHMPVASYVGALANVGGAVGGGNNIHIRGGRRGEVAYLVDGMEVKDPLLNLRMLDVGSPAVAEMVALTGGFEAEYGNAQSAIVNVVTKEGSKEFHGRVKYVFDDPLLSPSPDTKLETKTTHFRNIFRNPDGSSIEDSVVTTTWQPPSNYQNYDYIEGSLGGPVWPTLGPGFPGYITFFMAGDITARNTNSNGIWIHSSPWFNHDASGWLGLDERRAATFLNSTFQLTYHMNPKMKLKAAYRTTRDWYNVYVMRQSRHFPNDFSQDDINRAFHKWARTDTTWTYVSGADDDGDGRIDEEALNGLDDDLDGRVDEDLQWYEYNATDHLPMRKIHDDQWLLTWNHTLNQRTYYNIKLSRYMASRQIRGMDKDPGEYGEPEEPFTDLPGPDGSYNGIYDPGEPFVDLDHDGIWDPGNPGNNYPDYRGFMLQGDGTDDNVGQPVPAWYRERSFVWASKFQLTSQLHRYHQLRTGLDLNFYSIDNEVRPYPTIDNEGKGIYTDIYRVRPTDGAAYLQDKMEYKDITMTLGTRLDFYMPGEQVRHVMAFDTFLADGSPNPDWSPSYVAFKVPDKFKTYVSPRLGVSFFVTEDAYLHAHYGHFYQRPRWNDLFEEVNQIQTGGTPRVGNPDLEPEKTVSYEVGISWNPYADYLIDVTGFLKDVKNWINTRDGYSWFSDNFPDMELPVKRYAIYDNQDYAFSRGIEFNLSKEYGSKFSGRITYTLSWTNAKNSYNISTQLIRENYVEPPQALPAGWDQRHSMVANFGMRYDPQEPLFGINGMPGDWEMNLIWNVRSGLPYTPTDRSGTRIEGQYMSKRTPSTDAIDLNLTKFLTFGRWQTSLWLEVRNLFNRRNLLHVDDYYGRVGAPEAFDDYSGMEGWLNDSVSPNYVLNPFSGPNPEAWDNPRFIRLGLGLAF